MDRKLILSILFSFIILASCVYAQGNDDPNWEAISVVIVIVGGVVGWFLGRRKQNKVSKLLTQIDSEYISYKTKPKQCEAELYKLRSEITEGFKKGKIDVASFSVLDKRIDSYLSEIRERIVDDQFEGAPDELRDQVLSSLEDGEIDEREFRAFLKILGKTKGIDAKTKDKFKRVVSSWKRADLNEVKAKEKQRSFFGRMLLKIPWNLRRIAIFNIIVGIFLFIVSTGPMKEGNPGGAFIIIMLGLLMIISGILNLKKKKIGVKIAKYIYWVLLVLGVIILLTQHNPIGLIFILISVSIVYHIREMVMPVEGK